jgi:type IV pilus assembly protein PilB
MGFLSDQEVTNFLSQQYRVPTINLDEYEVARDILHLVSKDLCEKHLALPVSRAGSSLIVAMVDPKDEAAFDELRRSTGLSIEPVIATERAIRSAVERYYKADG